MKSNRSILREVQTWVEDHVSARRLHHIEGVAETASRLARRYGVSQDRVLLAAWLHDAAKEMPHKLHRHLMKGARDPWDRLESRLPELRHPKAAAALARRKWGLKDREVIRAVQVHTLGRPGMGKLELILFVADYIEPTRNFPGIETVRRMARRNLKDAALLKAAGTLAYLLQSGAPIHPNVVETYNDLAYGIRSEKRKIKKGRKN